MKKTIFVISDLHLGGAPAGNGKPSFQMCSPEGRGRLAEFIRYVADQKATADREIHLIINGDIVDFLAEEQFVAFTASDQLAREKLDHVLSTTVEVWESLKAFVKTGSRLTLLLGNHDIELSLPSPRRLLLQELGAGRVEFIYDNQAYVEGPVLIEHGNRYDSWNIVSHDALREIRSVLSRGEPSVTFEGPAGSHLVVNVMNRIKARYPFVDLLKPEDAGLLPFLAVLEPSAMKEVTKIIPLWRKQSQVRFNAQGIPTDLANIASSTLERDQEMIQLAWKLAQGSDAANVADAGVFERMKSILELWQLARSQDDKSVQLKRLYEALRARSASTWQTFDVNREAEQYIKPSKAAAQRGFKVVIFGHTHLVKRVLLNDQGAVYLNTGTWADLMAVPEAVLSGDEVEGKRQLEKFADALASNQLSDWRKQMPTFAQIELDGETVKKSDVYFFDGTTQVERVPDGRLKRLSN
jgi:UDP-2,3-diacylglucosamine pyrophosphatase LpxH